MSENSRISYYKSFFPVEEFCSFYAMHKSLQNREFSFVVKNDIYTRYRSYASAVELKKALLKDSPSKIDIGAIYNHSPKYRENLTPVAKEICIDIDISDYDDIRPCCKGASYCSKCWKLMNAAIDILNYELEEWFGFQNVMWVFSGRRGIHGWIYDSRVIDYTHAERASVAEFIHITGKNVDNVSINLPFLHPSFHPTSLLFKKAEQWFLKLAEDMGWMVEEAIRNYIPDNLKAEVQRIYENSDSIKTTWELIKACLLSEKNKNFDVCQRALLTIVYSKVYPRLDIEVSKTTHHLLKAPFAIHPGTGLVCTVIPKDEELQFYPSDAPHFESLIQKDPRALESFQKSVNALRACASQRD